ncbi:hypothetical protein LCGC14_1522100 [marine sediment metagenome]|uniref:Uncharacterized protein n=1 Tax=marine sediment metagenome TaxID=412755 RepID=A0A0F9IYC4_9ZZZZ
MGHIKIDPGALPDVILEMTSGIVCRIGVYHDEELAQAHADRWARRHDFKDFNQYREESDAGDMKDELVWKTADCIHY